MSTTLTSATYFRSNSNVRYDGGNGAFAVRICVKKESITFSHAKSTRVHSVSRLSHRIARLSSAKYTFQVSPNTLLGFEGSGRRRKRQELSFLIFGYTYKISYSSRTDEYNTPTPVCPMLNNNPEVKIRAACVLVSCHSSSWHNYYAHRRYTFKADQETNAKSQCTDPCLLGNRVFSMIVHVGCTVQWTQTRALNQETPCMKTGRGTHASCP